MQTIKLIPFKNLLSAFVIISLASVANIANAIEGQVMKVDPVQVNTWNRFAETLIEFHHYRLVRADIEVRESVGGYSGMPEFYRQIEYYEKQTGLLMSRIQWEQDQPNTVHTIEVFIYDPQGRVKVDYLAAFLPEHRNAPIQTLINLHGYNGSNHSFRQFDASGVHIYEQCKGKHQGKELFISLEEHELTTPHGQISSHRQTDKYQSCFEQVPTEVSDYLDPFEVANISRGTGQQATDETAQIENEIAQLDKQLFKDIKNAGLYLRRADLHFKLNNLDQAIDDYSTAIQYDAKLDKAYFGRGMALGRAGFVEDAVSDLSVYIDRNPNDSVGYTKRGVRYIWLGRLESAKQDLLKAISLDATNAEAHDDLGVIYAQQGDYKNAMSHFQQSIKHDRTYQKAYHNLAMVYYAQNNPQRALGMVEQAVNLSPDNKNTLLLKATILEALGRHQEANRIIEQAEFLPDGNWTERMQVMQ